MDEVDEWPRLMNNQQYLDLQDRTSSPHINTYTWDRQKKKSRLENDQHHLALQEIKPKDISEPLTSLSTRKVPKFLRTWLVLDHYRSIKPLKVYA